jgi:hypothetical protein
MRRTKEPTNFPARVRGARGTSSDRGPKNAHSAMTTCLRSPGMKGWTAVVAAAALLVSGCGANDTTAGSTTERASATTSTSARGGWGSSSPTASQAPASPSDSQITAEARQFVADNVGQPDGQFINATGSAWAPYITDFTFHAGVLRVSMQVDRNSADGQNAGTMAAKAIASFIRLAGSPNLRSNINWVEAADGTGASISQNQV